MTKPNKLRDNRTTMHVDQRVIEPLPTVETSVEVVGETTATTEGVTVPVPKRYTPPNCSLCTELRPKREESYVEVKSTQRQEGFIFRYCRCGFCGNTFKVSEKV